METQYETVVDRRFGFPVSLIDVPMRRIGTHVVPDIDATALADHVAAALVCLRGRFTGHHLRFVRKRMECTMEAFGQRLGVTHAAVSKWESAGDEPPRLALATEVLVRLTLLTTVPTGLIPFRMPRAPRERWLATAMRDIQEYMESPVQEDMQIRTARDIA